MSLENSLSARLEVLASASTERVKNMLTGSLGFTVDELAAVINGDTYLCLPERKTLRHMVANKCLPQDSSTMYSADISVRLMPMSNQDEVPQKSALVYEIPLRHYLGNDIGLKQICDIKEHREKGSLTTLNIMLYHKIMAFLGMDPRYNYGKMILSELMKNSISFEANAKGIDEINPKKLCKYDSSDNSYTRFFAGFYLASLRPSFNHGPKSAILSEVKSHSRI
ncbi:MAG TPA: hypothetical protein VI564_01190 [Candidatus Nanoarchaeia archaeon]|nr:hypothetical protein [Candidatus Nanoarchaeia archaeon]